MLHLAQRTRTMYIIFLFLSAVHVVRGSIRVKIGQVAGIIKVLKKFILLSGRNGSNTEPTDVLSYAV